MEIRGSAGKFFLVSMLLMAGIGAAVAPFLADLITAAAGAPVFYCLALVVWTMVRQGSGQGGTTNLLKAV
ncbi:MAG TPA: hypothetical protein VHU23_10885 [Rhizomicrobium sp.]|jgi:hypothetical protein|nr:hypothetical protein [Rhizomicrobium sp.]